MKCDMGKSNACGWAWRELTRAARQPLLGVSHWLKAVPLSGDAVKTSLSLTWTGPVSEQGKIRGSRSLFAVRIGCVDGE